MRRLLNQVTIFAKESVSLSVPIIKCLSLLHVTGTYVCSPVLVYGPSMLPTLNFTGDVLLTEHFSPLLGMVGPGDVVIARSPENPRKMITKRVVGIEGDEITSAIDDRTFTVEIPEGHVWLEGDNKFASRDSRQLGPIPYGLIVGKVFCRVWPPRDLGLL